MYRNDTFPGVLPHARTKREKLFGDGRPVPLDRNAKCRVLTRAKALTHPTQKGKHYGAITAKALGVLVALLWGFHNARTGLCFPSYETIAEKAGCTTDTVGRAIRMLEAAGILTWCNRLARVRINGVVKVIRTSNSYRFRDPGSKAELQRGTPNQDIPLLVKPAKTRPRAPSNPLEQALGRLGKAVEEEARGSAMKEG
jgi:hypothetical protein